MKNLKVNSNNKLDYSRIELPSLKKRALINLVIMPIYLILFFVLIFLQWKVSINWVTAPEVKIKFFWLAVGLSLILITVILGYYVRRFSNWVYSRNVTTIDTQKKTSLTEISGIRQLA